MLRSSLGELARWNVRSFAVIILALVFASVPTWALAEDRPMGVSQSDFGKTHDGKSVELYTLTNSHGLSATVMTYGAILVELNVPDRDGKLANVNCGFTKLSDYEDRTPFFGATVGRYANRIGKATFTLDGKVYKLAANERQNAIHGGRKGFDKKMWTAEPVKTSDGASVKFSYVSPDGEEGYPGTLSVSCTYTLGNDNSLKYEFQATTDKPTVLNLANHSYLNIAGEGNGTVLDQILTITGNRYCVLDKEQIPTGEIRSVIGTPLDFTTPTPIGARIDQVPGGYDFNYCLDNPGPTPTLAGRLKDPKSGRVLEILTTQAALQIYTSNHLDGRLHGPSGKPYLKYGAICFETQHWPDSPNHPDFPSTRLNPGEKFDQTTILKFSAE